MFVATRPMHPNKRRLAPQVSIIVHCAFLAWVVHSPRPIFVAPSSVVRGEGGTRVTRLYWPRRPSDSGKGEFKLSAPVWKHKDARLEVGKERKLPPPTVAQDETAGKNSTESSAGSRYGSVTQGQLSGADVRPALPIRGSDPQVYPGELLKEGDVIVEITIDEVGNIIGKKVLRSITPAIDQRVLAALDSWHFHPATRDGVPIPSKQDVHYHFKPS